MSHPDKSCVRLAVALHGLLAEASLPPRVLELPTGTWRQAERLAERVRRAGSRGWHLAARRLRRDLRYALGSVSTHLREIEQTLFDVQDSTYLATANDLYRDLDALAEQFDSCTIDPQAQFLAVVTEPISLDSHYLGPFEIRLELRRPLHAAPYRVIALDPHPAANRDGVTHPHVSDEVLCEGEGQAAIRQALAQGRLLDFFEIVRRLLKTYNLESAFVELALWDGEDCSDCGESARPEDRYECQRCESVTCIDCATTCGACECSYCAHCICKCLSCKDAFCGDCLRNCAVCRSDVCTSCLDSQERCTDCHEEEPTEDLDAPAQPAGITVHADGLGQVAVPA